MRRRFRLRLGTVVLVGALVAGCGSDGQSEPATIPPDDVPFDLLAEAPQPDVVPGPATPFTYPVFLVGPRGLVEALRSGPTVPGLETRLGAVTKGLTRGERDSGLRTEIPPGTTVRRVQIVGAVVAVDLGGAFGTATGNDRIVALAQIVYTVTESIPSVRVSFELDGRGIDVPRGNGALTGAPVGRDDYSAMVIERLVTSSKPSSTG